MERIISATQARIRFGEVMQEAQKTPIIVEKDGKPQVVVLSKRAYDALMAAAPGQSWRNLLEEAHRRVREELAGRNLPAPEDIIVQEREARSEQFDHLH
jgi:prevent-host-death family protein